MMMEMFFILTSSISMVLQDATIGENQVKNSWDPFVLFLTIACEFIIILKCLKTNNNFFKYENFININIKYKFF